MPDYRLRIGMKFKRQRRIRRLMMACFPLDKRLPKREFSGREEAP
jgi:hypothetical protein